MLPGNSRSMTRKQGLTMMQLLRESEDRRPLIWLRVCTPLVWCLRLDVKGRPADRG
jgi:hypothetical protein